MGGRNWYSVYSVDSLILQESTAIPSTCGQLDVYLILCCTIKQKKKQNSVRPVSLFPRLYTAGCTHHTQSTKQPKRSKAKATQEDVPPVTVDELCGIIAKIGRNASESSGIEVEFKTLFDHYEAEKSSDMLMGLLMRAKRMTRLTYKGGTSGMLFQGRHDRVVIRILRQ